MCLFAKHSWTHGKPLHPGYRQPGFFLDFLTTTVTYCYVRAVFTWGPIAIFIFALILHYHDKKKKLGRNSCHLMKSYRKTDRNSLAHTFNFPARPVGYMYSRSDWFTVMSVRFVIGRRDSFWLVLLHTRLKTALLRKMIRLKRFALCSHPVQSDKKTKPHVIHSSFFLCFALVHAFTSSYDWFRSLRIVRVLTLISVWTTLNFPSCAWCQ